MEQTTWWQTLVLILGAVGGFEFIKWVFNRKTEKRLNNIEVKQKDFELDEKRIAELHSSIDKANKLNDDLLERLSQANATINKHIDRSRELSDRLYKSEQETNRVNDELTLVQRKNSELERRLGQALRLVDFYKEWRCEWADCRDPRGRRPPNHKLKGKKFSEPNHEEEEDIDDLNNDVDNENSD